MRKLFTIVSLLALASMVLAACGGAAPATQPPAAATQPPAAATEAPAMTEAPAATGDFMSSDATTYNAVTFGDPETLDPALDYETAGGGIVENVYETLVWYNKDHADQFIPQLATDWNVSDDGTTYTFNIRQGVKFHNGDTLTPDDVAYTFQRGLLQGGYSSPQWLLAEPFFGVGNDDITCIVDGCASADDREALSANDSATLLAACQTVQSAISADDFSWNRDHDPGAALGAVPGHHRQQLGLHHG